MAEEHQMKSALKIISAIFDQPCHHTAFVKILPRPINECKLTKYCSVSMAKKMNLCVFLPVEHVF